MRWRVEKETKEVADREQEEESARDKEALAPSSPVARIVLPARQHHSLSPLSPSTFSPPHPVCLPFFHRPCLGLTNSLRTRRINEYVYYSSRTTSLLFYIVI